MKLYFSVFIFLDDVISNSKSKRSFDSLPNFNSINPLYSLNVSIILVYENAAQILLEHISKYRRYLSLIKENPEQSLPGY